MWKADTPELILEAPQLHTVLHAGWAFSTISVIPTEMMIFDISISRAAAAARFTPATKPKAAPPSSRNRNLPAVSGRDWDRYAAAIRGK